MKDKTLKIMGLKPDVRCLYDMKKVIYDKKWLKTAPNFKLYYMYRGLKPKKNQLLTTLEGKKKKNLRYDITIIPPRMLGKEFVKTKGHYHIGSYGEIYIVLKGKAIYLMQKEKRGKVEDVYYIKAKKGDYILIPPYYSHITINPSSKELKMANWISKECKSDYKPIERKKGGCYYYTKSGWIKNRNYKKVPKLRYKRPKKSFPKNLSFLK